MAEVAAMCNGGGKTGTMNSGLRPIGRPRSDAPSVPSPSSARALDCDEFASVGEARRDWSHDLVALDPAEGRRLREVPRSAIGGGHDGPTVRSAREAAVDTVAVRVVRDDEDAVFEIGRASCRERGWVVCVR